MTWSGYSEQGTGSQERGPGSFSVDVPGVPTQQGAPQFVPIRAGGDMRTDGSISVPGRVPQDNTLTVLAKMAQDWLAPKIEAEKERLFLEGMHRAAAGVAVQEIAAEQGTLSKLFGEAPAVEGARAYTVMAKKSAFVTDFQTRMPELAATSPDQWPSVLQQEMQKHLTGDPATDAALQREFLTVAPDLSRQYTKASYLYHQGEAKKARVTAMNGAVSQYSAVLRADPATRSQDQVDKAEQSLLETWTPPDGVDEDSHMDDLTDSLVTDLRSGNFDAARLAYDSKLIARLGPERALKIELAAERSAPKALRKVRAAMVSDLVDFAVRKSPTDADYLARWNEINDKASELSGVPREFGDLIDASVLVNVVEGAVVSAGRRATNPEVREENAETIIRDVVQKAEGSRSGSTAINFPGMDIKDTEVQRTLGKVYYERPPVQQAQLLRTFSGHTIEAASDNLQQMFETVTQPGANWKEHGPAFEKLLVMWDNMGPTAQERYFKPRQLEVLNLWERKVKAGTQPELLFGTTSAMQRTDPAALAEDPPKESIQAVIEEHLYAVAQERTLGALRGQRPLDEDRTVLATFSEEEMQRATALTLGIAKRQGGRHADPKRRAEYAFAEAIRTGEVDVMGGRLYINEDPDEARNSPLKADVPPETAGIALDGLITAGLKKQNVEGNNRTVIRVRGKPITYIAVAVNKDGNEVFFKVTEDDVRANLKLGERNLLRDPGRPDAAVKFSRPLVDGVKQ